MLALPRCHSKNACSGAFLASHPKDGGFGLGEIKAADSGLSQLADIAAFTTMTVKRV